MGQVIEMSEQLAEYDVRKENGTDDISSRKNDVVQHWDSLINLLGEYYICNNTVFHIC